MFKLIRTILLCQRVARVIWISTATGFGAVCTVIVILKESYSMKGHTAFFFTVRRVLKLAVIGHVQLSVLTVSISPLAQQMALCTSGI
jgi:hypothetical protein